MTDIERLPEGLFREGLAAGGPVEIVLELQAFRFAARFQDGSLTTRLALGIRTAENENPEISHCHSLVLSEEMVVKTIVLLQGQLQSIQRTAQPGEDGDAGGG